MQQLSHRPTMQQRFVQLHQRGAAAPVLPPQRRAVRAEAGAQNSMDSSDAPSTSGRPHLELDEPNLELLGQRAGALIRHRRSAARSLEPLMAIALPAWLLGGAAEYLSE